MGWKEDMRCCWEQENAFDLHESGNEKVNITSQDKAVYLIDTTVRAYLSDAVRSIYRENERIRSNKESNPHLTRFLIHDILTPLEKRVMIRIRRAYLSDLDRFERDDFSLSTGISMNDFLLLFKQTAMRHYPFLDESDFTDYFPFIRPQSVDEIRSILAQSGIRMEEYGLFKKPIEPYITFRDFDIIYDVYNQEDNTVVDSTSGAIIPAELFSAVETLRSMAPSIWAPLRRMYYVGYEPGLLRCASLKKDLMLMKLLERKKAKIEHIFSEAFGQPVRLKIDIMNNTKKQRGRG